MLSGGAERGYSSLNFNLGGNKLASVASAPDFMLTVWDWQEERIALHAKAFGQDVFDVKFSLDDDRRLVTSGTGHIRFWKMASTFTGLKLQGYIGKFGKIELSDIQAFVELPDGKVVSGTETGALLLWEGNFIKCRFVQVNGQPCHASEVTYVELDRAEKCVVTASVDGYIRWWDYSAIDAAEVDSDVTMDFELFPVAEYFLGAGNGVLTLVDGGLVGSTRTMIIVDKRGCIETLKFDLAERMTVATEGAEAMEELLSGGQLSVKVRKLSDSVASLAQPSVSSEVLPPTAAPELAVCSEFHAGPVQGMDSSPLELLVATAGADGTVRCWDVASKRLLASKTFGSSCSSLRWLPSTADSTGKHILVGFVDGMVRLLMLGEDDNCNATWSRKMVFKPHNGGVTDLRFNDEGTLLATAGKDGNVFIFNCTETAGPNGSYTPLRFFVVNPTSLSFGKPTTCERLSWSADSKKLLCTCSDSVLREVDVSVLLDRITLDVETYEHVFPVVEFAGKVQLLAISENKLNAAPGSPVAGAAAAAASADNEASSEAKDGEAADSAASQAASLPSSPSKKNLKDGDGKDEPAPSVPLKVSSAIYSIGRAGGSNGIFTGATVGPRAYLYECTIGQEAPDKELPLGVYSVEGKNAVKAPVVTSLAYGVSKKFVVSGTADGSVVVRPAAYPEVFFRVSAHNGAVLYATLSHDDRFIVSCGLDGTLQVHVLIPGVEDKALEIFKDVDAGVFGDAIVKPPAKAGVVEPSYLTVLKSTDPSPAVQAAAALAAASSGDPAAVAVAVPAEVLTTPELLAPVLPHVTSDNENLELPAGAYSIQDAKLKSEEDAKLLTADALKEKIRLIVKTLQRDYQRVVENNAALPAEVRVPNSELTVDGDYFETLRTKGDLMVSEVHKENAYEAEKARRLREKITQHLMPELLVEEITLSSLSKTGRPRSLVKSLRTQGISPSVREICEKVRESIKEETLSQEDKARAEARMLGAGSGGAVSMEDFVAEDATADLHEGTGAGSKTGHGHDGTGHGSGPAQRREMRRQRKLKLKEHLKQKPNENDDDPRDVAAIAHAEKTLGVYNLKSADDYEVPEGQRINAEKKKQQMALLEDSMVKLRLEFNERFLALRDLKCDLIASIRANNKRVREIDEELLQPELSAGSALWEPRLDVSEFPDDRGEVTEAELERYMEERKKVQQWQKCPPVPNAGITNSKSRVLRSLSTGEYITSAIDLRERLNFGAVEAAEAASAADDGDASAANAAAQVDLVIPLADPSMHLSDARPSKSSAAPASPMDFQVNDNALAAFASSISQRRAQYVTSVSPVLQLARDGKRLKMKLDSGLEATRIAQAERRRVLEFERVKLLETIDTNTTAFEEAVDELRVERQQLTGDLKQAELKLLTYFQEYQLLLQFEGRDISLQQKQLKSVQESADIRAQVLELEGKLEGKREELKHWQEKGAVVAADFRSAVPENHGFVDQLSKIFRRKIKRTKMGGDAAEAEEEEQDLGDEDEDEEDDEEAEDVCPVGCDPALYEKVVDLREKRVDVDEAMGDVQKGLDDGRKALDRLKQRDKQVAKDVQMVELEIRQFQKQKLASLNQIEIFVPLKLGQIYAFTQSGILTGPEPREKTGAAAAAEVEAAAAAAEPSDADAEAAAAVAELRDPAARKLISDMTIKTHVVVNAE